MKKWAYENLYLLQIKNYDLLYGIVIISITGGFLIVKSDKAKHKLSEKVMNILCANMSIQIIFSEEQSLEYVLVPLSTEGNPIEGDFDYAIGVAYSGVDVAAGLTIERVPENTL